MGEAFVPVAALCHHHLVCRVPRDPLYLRFGRQATSAQCVAINRDATSRGKQGKEGGGGGDKVVQTPACPYKVSMVFQFLQDFAAFPVPDNGCVVDRPGDKTRRVRRPSDIEDIFAVSPVYRQRMAATSTCNNTQAHRAGTHQAVD